jgi:hypothetical protein
LLKHRRICSRNSDEEKRQNWQKLHRTLAEPMQERYTAIEEKCNKCQKSSFAGGHMKESI